MHEPRYARALYAAGSRERPGRRSERVTSMLRGYILYYRDDPGPQERPLPSISDPIVFIGILAPAPQYVPDTVPQLLE